ncbi:tautomerase family protein [Actinoplanes aureus]|uniref:Tautomerase family protein n=1 Tax=Actinoplanes aureus TaxID=2792083 RepID=A0A931G166_9ACTN|nr:tautomerase family protein [Actinoplanes aureus]MBG0566685.1 tautomerase family protein [Actinoplanes aureus]
MPNITVELLAGRSVEQRKAFARAVTDHAVEILGARPQDVRMVFNEITPDVVANGGVLASEDPTRAGVLAALDKR